MVDIYMEVKMREARKWKEYVSIISAFVVGVVATFCVWKQTFTRVKRQPFNAV